MSRHHVGSTICYVAKLPCLLKFDEEMRRSKFAPVGNSQPTMNDGDLNIYVSPYAYIYNMVQRSSCMLEFPADIARVKATLAVAFVRKLEGVKRRGRGGGMQRMLAFHSAGKSTVGTIHERRLQNVPDCSPKSSMSAYGIEFTQLPLLRPHRMDVIYGSVREKDLTRARGRWSNLSAEYGMQSCPLLLNH